MRSVKIPREKAISLLQEAIAKSNAIEAENEAMKKKYETEFIKWFGKLPKREMKVDLTTMSYSERGRIMVAFDCSKFHAPKRPEYKSNPFRSYGQAERELKLLQMSTEATVSVPHSSVIYNLL